MKKRNTIIYWVATLWLSLGMLSTGIVQLLHIKAGTGGADSMLQLGYPLYMLTLLGVLKIAGVGIILLPGLTLLKEWAYAGFAFVITGAVYSHAAIGDHAATFFGPLLLLVLLVLSWYYRPANRKINFTTIKS
ncbi:MAG: DoxX family protein [Bacteroidetes bacterium]|nr:DoxX family protein [Bacteroidota bacterium]